MGSSSEGSKPSRQSVCMVPLRPRNSDEQEHPVYCPCKECSKQEKIKPANCPSFIKETPVTWSEMEARPGFSRSQSVPDDADIKAAVEQRRKSVLNPFPELERGISYISDGVQLLPDRKNKTPRYGYRSSKYRSERRPPSVSSDSSSSMRFQPPGPLPNGSVPRHSNTGKQHTKHPANSVGRRKLSLKSHETPKRSLPIKVSYSDEHSSAILSDDEMSDESVRLNRQLLHSTQPRVTFADVESKEVESKDDMNVYLEMSLIKQPNC